VRFVVVAAFLIAATPAFALDAITYKGTLGRSEIIVELTDPAQSMMVGRYSYLQIGGDIPLHNLDGIVKVELAEEAPCTEETCVADENNTIIDPPIGANWSLNFDANGAGLLGHWTQAGSTDKRMDVTLVEIGRRTLPPNTDLSPKGLADSAFIRIYAYGDPVTPALHPYEFAKMQVSPTEGAVQELDRSKFRFVSDPRTQFGFPRIVALADGSSLDAANLALASRHAAINVAAFSCLNTAYSGFSFSPYDISMTGGSLGDFDGESVAIGYLSPTVMGWTEAGSTWCGGAHPNNHFNSFIIDLKTGETLPLGKVFKHWTATSRVDDDGLADEPIDQAAALTDPDGYFWHAGQPLIDYVLANYKGEAVEGCATEELIYTNLGVRFGPRDTAIFTLEDLPHAIFACTEDVLTVKLADIPELLAPTAKDYFPSLAR
jgi:hypothetical protein